MSDAEDVPAPRPKRGRKTLFAMCGCLGFVVLALAGYMLFAPMEASADATDPPAAEIVSSDPGEEASLTVHEIGEIVVDIAGTTIAGDPARRFLKANFVVVHPDTEAARARFGDRAIHLRDTFVEYARLLHEIDVIDSAGMSDIRADLLHRARMVIGDDHAREILVSDLVVQ